MIKMGNYDHLNREDKVIVELDIESLAKKIVDMNYGSARFLAALVRARRENEKTRDEKILTNGIEDLLNKGHY